MRSNSDLEVAVSAETDKSLGEIDLEQAKKALEMRLASANMVISQLRVEAERMRAEIARSKKVQQSVRFDLDGTRLTDPEGKDVWLVLNGRRRKCFNSEVYCALFVDINELTVLEDPGQIESGHDLMPGTSLIKSIDDGVIYLAAFGDKCVLHKIRGFETFVRCGFNPEKVHLVPSPLIMTCNIGRAL